MTEIKYELVIGFSGEGFPEGPPAVFASLAGWAFRLNDEIDVIVCEVHEWGIVVQEIPRELDPMTFHPHRYPIEWKQVHSLVYF